MQNVVAVEGVSGSGKTVLINKLINVLGKRYSFVDYFSKNAFSDVKVVNEVRLKDEKPSTVKVDFRRYLYGNLNALQGVRDEKSVILDRSYISTFATTYARAIIQRKSFELDKELNKFVKRKKELPNIDAIVLCECDPEIAIDRRDSRDGYSHKFWSNKKFVQYAQEQFEKIPEKLGIKVIKINTDDELTNKEIYKLAKEIKNESYKNK